jgi:hypothetical protein
MAYILSNMRIPVPILGTALLALAIIKTVIYFCSMQNDVYDLFNVEHANFMFSKKDCVSSAYMLNDLMDGCKLFTTALLGFVLQIAIH